MSASSSHFVGKAVITTSETRKIIDQIRPFMPPGTTIIGGYLNSKQQVFKLNYHWELLVHNIGRCLSHCTSEVQRKHLHYLQQTLEHHAPHLTGYLKAHSVDELPDRSDNHAILQRWKAVKQAKREFASFVQNGGFERSLPEMSEQMRLIRSPILPPGHSHHSTGKALDIRGTKPEIEKMCWALGATLVFTEDSHVHVEFLHGVLSKPDYSRHGHSHHHHTVHHRH